MKRSLVAVLSAIAILALSVVPVGAHTTQVPPHTAAVAFTGTAKVAPGLSSPVTGSGVSGSGVKGNWSFSITSGAGGHYAPPSGSAGAGGILVGGNTLPGGAQVAAGTFGGSAGGILYWGIGGYGAWCGYSSGFDGTGSIAFTPLAGVTLQGVTLAPAAVTVTLAKVGWVQSAATVIPFNGLVEGGTNAAYHGTIHGVVSAIPPNPATGGPGTCLAVPGTATDFTIVGGAAAVWQD